MVRDGALLLGAVKPRLVPILISIAGACLIGLLIYGISTQSASRTLDDQVAEGGHPPSRRTPPARLPVLGGHGTQLAGLAARQGRAC